MKEHMISNGFRDFWMYISFTLSMARDVRKFLKEEKINKVSLNAFVTNKIGNAFWQRMNWTLRSDMNYYDYTLNENNLTEFVKFD